MLVLNVPTGAFVESQTGPLSFFALPGCPIKAVNYIDSALNCNPCNFVPSLYENAVLSTPHSCQTALCLG